ncbi:class I adenylate-forming enzyme family protein [Oceanobacillus kimchii]|uniref:class I adenylate-forming enzyme family protein n=1 Tax=Oceanobacillus kimchii TaxID=746691 RepID=UPI00098539E7|nr:AMP-binding protein [Oceanobacillus kimchii]
MNMTLSTNQQLLEKLSTFTHQSALTCLTTNYTITYEQLNEKVTRIIHYLSGLGIDKDTKVATVIPNSIDSVLFGIAIGRLGATLVPLNPKLGLREVTFILQDASPKAVITATKKHIKVIEDYQKKDPNAIKVLGIPDIEAEGFPDTFKIFRWVDTVNQQITIAQASPADIARIAYTGGTTGTPKGVMHTQQNLVAEMECASIEYPYDDQDKVLFVTPIVHSAGVLMHRSLFAGCHIYIDRSFNPERFLQTVEEEKITSTFVVPTIIYRLIDEAKKNTYDVSSLRNMNYGSSPISSARLKEAFAIFGPTMRQQYGMTECSILISRLTKSDHIWALEHEASVLGSCGKPCLQTEIMLEDVNGNYGTEVKRGEILVKSPCVAVSYYNREDLTKEAFRDGWFYTGDIGEIDENGFLYIVERKKDMIISGGLNIYSVEVEQLINKHPAVAACACIGIPDEDWGEAVCVFVVLRNGKTCTKEELLQYCKEKTSAYMVPKEIIFQDSFPLTTVGKIDKKQLKKPYWENQYRNVH